MHVRKSSNLVENELNLFKNNGDLLCNNVIYGSIFKVFKWLLQQDT